jgi:hypothetical protein
VGIFKTIGGFFKGGFKLLNWLLIIFLAFIIYKLVTMAYSTVSGGGSGSATTGGS